MNLSALARVGADFTKRYANFTKLVRHNGVALISMLLTDARVWDNVDTHIGSAANDDLGTNEGTYGTNSPTIRSSDGKAATVTQYCRWQVPFPWAKKALATAKVVVNAGMVTTVSDTSAVVDIQCFRVDAPTVDICTTAAQSINSLTKADKEFSLDITDLAVGDILDIRLKIAIVDGATGTAVIGEVASVKITLT